MLRIPSTPTNESICGPKRHESAVDHEYPKSLAHSQQTSSVTRHRPHTQPISWGGRPPILGDRGQQSESLFELLCSPSACLGPFRRETSLTFAITVRFHSFLVCIDVHNTEHDQNNDSKCWGYRQRPPTSPFCGPKGTNLLVTEICRPPRSTSPLPNSGREGL